MKEWTVERVFEEGQTVERDWKNNTYGSKNRNMSSHGELYAWE